MPLVTRFRYDQSGNCFLLSAGAQIFCVNKIQLKQAPLLVKAFGVLERSRWLNRDLELYEKYVDVRRVEEGVLKTAEIRGEAIGEKKSSIKIARDMLTDGFDDATICELTELSEQEVEALKSDK